MSAGLRPEWRFGLRLVLAFSLWNVLVLPLLPAYARLVVPFAQWSLKVLRPHDAQVVFTDVYPHVKWQVTYLSQVRDESVSFGLLVYNLILYLSLLTTIPRVRWTHRSILLLSGLPILFLFYGIDLVLIVESKLLTWLQPQHYAFWEEFDLWFSAAKFYHSFSVMAFKQVLPLLVLWLQWHGLRKFTRLGEKIAETDS